MKKLAQGLYRATSPPPTVELFWAPIPLGNMETPEALLSWGEHVERAEQETAAHTAAPPPARRFHRRSVGSCSVSCRLHRPLAHTAGFGRCHCSAGIRSGPVTHVAETLARNFQSDLGEESWCFFSWIRGGISATTSGEGHSELPLWAQHARCICRAHAAVGALQ